MVGWPDGLERAGPGYAQHPYARARTAYTDPRDGRRPTLTLGGSMNRFASIQSAIWADEDFCDLPAEAQRMYFLLLSQPKLTLCGALDYMPTRWARLSPNTTVACVEAAVEALAHAGFVCVDHDTCEVVVRTYVRHGHTTTKSWKLLKGLWSSLEGVSSAQLRAVIARELPEHVLKVENTVAPAWIMQARDSNPTDTPPDRGIRRGQDTGSEGDTELRTTCYVLRATEEPPTRVGVARAATGSRSRALASLGGEGFGQWWESYPRKVAKTAAGKAYGKALASGATPAQLADALGAWNRQWTAERRDPSKLPYPATWLNRGDWDSPPSGVVPIAPARLTSSNQALMAVMARRQQGSAS